MNLDLGNSRDLDTGLRRYDDDGKDGWPEYADIAKEVSEFRTFRLHGAIRLASVMSARIIPRASIE